MILCDIIKMAIYSNSSIQNVNNWRFWIRKTNALLNLIKEQDSDNLIDKIIVKISGFDKKTLRCRNNKHLNDPKEFVEHSITLDNIYNNIDHYNPTRKGKILIVFDDMIADTMTNKKFQAIIKKLFIRGRK